MLTKQTSEKENTTRCEDNNSSARNEIIKKRKDPKTMTIDELEEYISRNKTKFKNENTDSKSLNSSFQSQRKLNISFNDSCQVFSKLNEKVKTKVNETHSKLNSSNIDSTYQNNNNNNIINHPGVNMNYLNNVNNPFLNPIAQSPREHLATNCSNPSEAEEKQGKFNSNNPNSTTAVINSKAASNYLKSLQDKIKQLNAENDELKSNFCQISEILENERSEFKSKLDNEILNCREVEKVLRNERSAIENENRQLIKENEEMKVKLSLQGSTLAILEKEKGRHLEQNALDREEFEIQNESLRKENEENKLKLLSLNSDNNILREKLARTNDDLTSLEKTCQMLKEESQILKKDQRERTGEHQKELEEYKIKIEAEQGEWIANLKSLKEIISQLEKEKKEMRKKYEKNLHELAVKINRLEGNNKTPSSSYLPVNKNIITSSQVKSKSKSKEKMITGKKKVVKVSPSLKTSQMSVKSSKVNNRVGLNEKLTISPKSPKSVSSNKSLSNSGKAKTKKVKKVKKSSELQLSNSNSNNNLNTSLSPRQMILSQSSNDDSSIQVNYMKSPTYNNNVYEQSSLRAANSTSYDQQLMEINDGIFGLERNIADLNRNYKTLLTKLNTSITQEEATLLKRNINLIASNLQDQSEKLLDLKRQQQELLKKSLAYSN